MSGTRHLEWQTNDWPWITYSVVICCYVRLANNKTESYTPVINTLFSSSAKNQHKLKEELMYRSYQCWKRLFPSKFAKVSRKYVLSSRRMRLPLIISTRLLSSSSCASNRLMALLILSCCWTWPSAEQEDMIEAISLFHLQQQGQGRAATWFGRFLTVRQAGDIDT